MVPRIIPIQSDEQKTRAKKAFEIASELLATEVTYVAKLHLIDQVIQFMSWYYDKFQIR